MNMEQAKRLIESGESQDTELKESFPGREKIAKTICGFANTNGGTLIIGVKKGGKVSGIAGSMDDLQRSVSVASQDIKSPPLLSQEIHEIDGKKPFL